MQVDRVGRNAALRVVFAENKIARLTVVCIHLGSMSFPFLTELVGASAIARFVRLMRAVEAGGSLCSFLAREITETVVLGLRIRGGVVEGCGVPVSRTRCH